MVRALLDGRKTQTRHAVNPQPFEMVQFIGRDDKPTGEFGWCPSARYIIKHITCPYGKPGDRLYVRETWAQPAALDPGPTVYRADYSACIPAGYENVPLASGYHLETIYPFGPAARSYGCDVNPWGWLSSFESLNREITPFDRLYPRACRYRRALPSLHGRLLHSAS
jgi:hypothetical protein